MIRSVALGILVVALASPAAAQERRSPEEQLAFFIERGLTSWFPGTLFSGCPNLSEWQQRAVELFLEADLAPDRTHLLAGGWISALVGCNDPRLEHWYVEKLMDGIRRGDSVMTLVNYWTAFQRADSPRIREVLRRIMTDRQLAESHREEAGAVLFLRLSDAERLDEYFRALEEMPAGVTGFQTDKLIRHHPRATIERASEQLRATPAVIEGYGFRHLVQVTRRLAPEREREQLATVLMELSLEPRASLAQRQTSARLAQFLRQPF